MWQQSPNDPVTKSIPVKVEEDNPPTKKKKLSMGKIAGGIGSLIGFLIAAYIGITLARGHTLFDLASCFAQDQPDPAGCAGRNLLSSSGTGITVVAPPGLGIRRNRLMRAFENVGFKFEGNKTSSGQLESTGKYNLTTLRLIGPDEDLSEVEGMVAPNDSTTPDELEKALGYLNALTNAILPDQKAALQKWVDDNPNALVNGGEISTTIENKVITFTANKEQRTIKLTIRRNSESK